MALAIVRLLICGMSLVPMWKLTQITSHYLASAFQPSVPLMLMRQRPEVFRAHRFHLDPFVGMR